MVVVHRCCLGGSKIGGSTLHTSAGPGAASSSPSKRTRDHKRNEETNLKRTAARRAAFIDLAKKGIDKLDAARRAWEEGATDWDPAQVCSVTKNRALTLRMMVARAYLDLLVQSENTQRLKKKHLDGLSGSGFM